MLTDWPRNELTVTNNVRRISGRYVRADWIIELEKCRHGLARVPLHVSESINSAIPMYHEEQRPHESSASLAGPVDTGLIYCTLQFVFPVRRLAKCEPSSVEKTVFPTPVLAPYI
jgi:hypothetical protein